MNTGAVDIVKAGVWCQFGSTDSVCPAWSFTAEQLTEDPEYVDQSQQRADGSWWVGQPTMTVRRVSLRGTVFGDHDPDGIAATNRLSQLRQNIDALRTALGADRATGDGRTTITIKEGSTTLGTVKATILPLRTSDWSTIDASAVISLVIHGDGT